MDKDVVIVSAVRTAVGKFGGTLKDLNSGQLGAVVIEEAVRRAGISPDMVNEVIMGEVRQSSESSNMARVAALRAGISESASAYTVNRLCASGMQAVASAVQQIVFGQADIAVAGGAESLSCSPIYLRNSRFGEGNPFIIDSNLENGQQPIETYGNQLGMGITAENVAERYSVTREDQDAFALHSQEKAAAAIQDGRFKDEIVPVEVKQKKKTVLFDTDEFPRQTSLQQLAALKPAFKQGGTVTAGNACGRNDGAAAMVLIQRDKARALGLTPLVRIVDWAVSGVSPEVMGIGPVSAIQKLLQRTGMRLSDFPLIELNEAFAAQSLAVIREAQLDMDTVNVNGGAIALGHPLGATGAKIMTTLLYEMKRRKEQFGMATLCVGGGQGMAIAIEQL
ncbi:thiolase family protein [Aneurinibacillus sp. Ricciae_BoGa-3]|uniref:thiolase family protein n=1 Tax=Aneurinibacillus sp. Ricciae_BoGa-3 TaxID=3022697 RepID=UPI0023413985|nr:thiolase family protein [Aneurinibacillus sp. Ricciae_BoGa-3]WCK52454.1 thiolase family protein [Aneurinibacillus sp. Ricciae_BoGa-3]